MQSPSHPHLLVFDQKWESNLTKTKVAQDWCLNNHNIVIRNWVPSKLCVLVATIKSLHKFCNLFPSSNTMLLITRRKNKLLTVLYVFYFCLLIAYKTSGYCTRIVVFIFLLIHSIQHPILFWTPEQNFVSADFKKILKCVSLCKNTGNIKEFWHIVYN